MKKQFSGQARDEKILLYRREYPLSFIMHFWIDIVTILVSSFLIFFIFYIVEYLIWAGILLSILVFVISIFYFFIMWKNTVLIVTNKRVLKFVREGIFKGHFKELKIYNLQENISKTGGLMGKLLDYGNVSFIGKDEKTVIWFRGTKYHNEIAMYVSRLRDYIYENPDYKLEEIKEFKHRKERYK